MSKYFRNISGDEEDSLWIPTNVGRYASTLDENKWIDLDARFARVGTEYTGVEGSVIFVGEDTYLDEDNPYFFYDKTNNRVGLGVNSGLTARLNFLSGTTAAAGIAFGSDVTLYRFAADILKTDDTFEVGANFRFPNTTTLGANGVFYKAGTRFLHAYGTNNIFLGQGSGNFTLSGGSGSNIGIGTNTLIALTSGQFNIVIGTNNGQSLTTGSSNTLIGLQCGRYITGSYNTALGDGALYGVIGSNTAASNVAIGRNIGNLVTTAANNTVVGTSAAEGLTTGSNNVFIGFQVANETGVTGSNNIVIGYDIDLPTVSTSNYLSIGNIIYGTVNTGQVSVGVSSQVASAILQVDSTVRGFLPPRMTTAQRNAISAPEEGLEVYDLTLHKKFVYDGTTWQGCW